MSECPKARAGFYMDFATVRDGFTAGKKVKSIVEYFSAICFAVLFSAVLAGPAKAGPSIVVELTSGRVLHAEQATRPWYPASLTKLMTVYVALEAVRQGRMKLQTPMRVSARASRASPSKMGFKPGIEVTLENALKIIMVKSANDVSITIAEGVSGSVEAFAAEMNATARRLGMTASHFANPNGLHHPDNVSSARDMAILGRSLYLHFPRQAGLYGIGKIRVGRRLLRTHNGLIGRYSGANGMKTGYICASGFNLVASATRYGKTLIAVIMGSPSPRVRTFQAMALLDKGFNSSSYGSGSVQSMARSAYRSAPNMRSEICNRKRRRVLIRQYMATLAPVAPRAATPSAYGDGDNSAAAFFARDKRGTFQQRELAPIGSLKLPPRGPLSIQRVYIGRAPGWTGRVAGPALAPDIGADNGKDKNNKVANANPREAGAPVTLSGAKTSTGKKTISRKKAKSRKVRKSRRAIKRSARRGRAKARISRRAASRAAKARKARAIRRAKNRSRSSARRSRRR